MVPDRIDPRLIANTQIRAERRISTSVDRWPSGRFRTAFRNAQVWTLELLIFENGNGNSAGVN